MAVPGSTRSPEEQLRVLGLDWQRLERLTWKALSDAKHQRRVYLDEYRDSRAHDFLFEVGLSWAYRYDAQLANGMSFATSVYRRMVCRFPDFLRAEHGDERTGTPLHTVATAVMPDRAVMDEESFEQAVDGVSAGLSTRALWTLRHLGEPIAESETPLVVAATQAGISVAFARELLEELRGELEPGYKPAEASVGEEMVA